MNKITLVLIDDHQLFLHSFASLFRGDERFHVVAMETDPGQGLKMIAKYKPSVVLTDIQITPVDGFQIASLVQELSPKTKVIGVSVYNQPAVVRKIFRAGAKGYVTKTASGDELIEAVLAVHDGKKFVCEDVQDIIARQQLFSETKVSLTATEFQVVGLVKRGLSSKEIAGQMDVSRKTVEVHRYNILRKLGLKNAASLVDYANKQGWL